MQQCFRSAHNYEIMDRALRAVYRQLLKQQRSMGRKGIELLEVRATIDREAWPYSGGKHGFAPKASDFHLQSLQRLLPWLAEVHSKGSFTPDEVAACVRSQFRSAAAAALPASERLDRAFDALRVLGEQLHLAECSSSATTDGVNVEVTTAYVGPQSALDPTYEEEEGVPQKHFFTYRIRVSNLGEHTVQLMARHWLIQNEKGETIVEVARGSKGVVGCTPVIKPGDCFAYYSGTDLESKRGSMHGSFQMVELDASSRPVRAFDAEVAPFNFIG